MAQQTVKTLQELIVEYKIPLEFQLMIEDLIKAGVKFIRNIETSSSSQKIVKHYKTLYFSGSGIQVDIFKYYIIHLEDHTESRGLTMFEYQFDYPTLNSPCGVDIVTFRENLAKIIQQLESVKNG